MSNYDTAAVFNIPQSPVGFMLKVQVSSDFSIKLDVYSSAPAHPVFPP